MDTVGERLKYALALRGKTANWLATQLKMTNMAREAAGISPIPWANTVRIYELLGGGEKPTPVEFVEAVASLLTLRPAWLAFSDGPCEADVPGDQWRELYLVDGRLRRFKPPDEPELRAQVRREFEAGFEAAEGFGRVSATVQVVFANYLAHHFERCREEPTGFPDQALWRGTEAANTFNLAVKKVRDGAKATGKPNSSPAWTAALLWAFGSRGMQPPTPPEMSAR